MPRTHKLLIATGLLLGAVLGLAGSFVPSDQLRAVLWTIDGVGSIIATVLLALHFFRAQQDLLAAGFLIYAIGESVMSAGNAGNLQVTLPTFAAGAALWSAGLMLTAIPAGLPLFARIAAGLASILFAITSLGTMAGTPMPPLAHPLPALAYPVLVLTLIGWVVYTVRQPSN
jgi:hypothetical protein